MVTGLSFVKLSSGFPGSDGFWRPLLFKLSGALVILAGIVSVATLAVEATVYLQDSIQFTRN